MPLGFLDQQLIGWCVRGCNPTSEEMEWYRLWFEFLQLSDRGKWSEKVARLFGEVSDTNFDDWWPSHTYLFRQLQPFIIDEIKTPKDFRVYWEDEPDEERDVIILAVNFSASRAALRTEFEKLLNNYNEAKVGRPEFDDWGDIFAFHQRPNTVMLKKVLEVYKRYKANLERPRDERMKKYKIEEEASRTVKIIDKEKKGPDQVKEAGPTLTYWEASALPLSYTRIWQGLYGGRRGPVEITKIRGKTSWSTAVMPLSDVLSKTEAQVRELRSVISQSDVHLQSRI